MVSHVNILRHCSHHNGSLTLQATECLTSFVMDRLKCLSSLPNLELALGFCPAQSDFAKLCSTQLGMMLTSGNGVRILTGQMQLEIGGCLGSPTLLCLSG
jgi:hypothetical protein